jgi:hypothetical protein
MYSDTTTLSPRSRLRLHGIAIIKAMTRASRIPRVTYQQGDHVCTLYSSQEERLTTAIQYIRGGLSRGERCVYVCCDQQPYEFRAALRSAGINVDAQEASGALVLQTKHDRHLEGGSFSPAKMIETLNTAVKDALDAGFTGLCTAGDMTWLLDEAPGSEKIVEYEARLNDFYSSNRALGLCQYDRNKLPAATLDLCLATHPWVRMEGPILLTNPFYELPDIAVARVPNPDDVERKLGHLQSARRRAGV